MKKSKILVYDENDSLIFNGEICNFITLNTILALDGNCYKPYEAEYDMENSCQTIKVYEICEPEIIRLRNANS